MKNQSLKESVASKKFWFSIFAIWSMAGFAWWAAGKLPMMVPMFDTFVGGVIAVTAAYLTGNIANKWVVGKTGGADEPAPPPKKTASSKQALTEDPLDRDIPGGK